MARSSTMFLALLCINVVLLVVAQGTGGFFKVDTTIMGKFINTPNDVTSNYIDVNPDNGSVFNATPKFLVAGSTDAGGSQNIGFTDAIKLFFEIFKILVGLLTLSITFWYTLPIPFTVSLLISLPFFAMTLFAVLSFTSSFEK